MNYLRYYLSDLPNSGKLQPVPGYLTDCLPRCKARARSPLKKLRAVPPPAHLRSPRVAAESDAPGQALPSAPPIPHPPARSGLSMPAEPHRAGLVLLPCPREGSSAGRSNGELGRLRTRERRGAPGPISSAAAAPRPGWAAPARRCAAWHGTAPSRRTALSLLFPCKTAPTPDRRKVSKRAAGPRLPPR